MTNHYSHYVNGKKEVVTQNTNNSWAVRKSLHKATVSGAVRLQTQKKVSLKDALNTDWHLIADKDIRKAKKTWPWKDMQTEKSTWNPSHVIKKKL